MLGCLGYWRLIVFFADTDAVCVVSWQVLNQRCPESGSRGTMLTAGSDGRLSRSLLLTSLQEEPPTVDSLRTWWAGFRARVRPSPVLERIAGLVVCDDVP